jgi:SAM-dependent methyltransferase
MKVEQEPATYDALYTEGGANNAYHMEVQESPYWPLFTEVLNHLRRVGVKNVLEVGCGNGAFAQMLKQGGNIQYRGFDFSAVAVRMAGERTGKPEWFSVADAREERSYTAHYDCVVCTEVLEHIKEDRDVVEKWRPGVRCVCSVPNYDSRYHERFFKREEDIYERYRDLLEIEQVTRVKVPDVYSGIGAGERFKKIVVNLYRPTRVRRYLGMHLFRDGGWFVFSGARKL